MQGDDAQQSRETAENSEKWLRDFLREVIVFQAKLVVDGLRDAALIPVSLVAALADVVSGGPARHGYFYEVLRLGKRSEQFIDLFRAAELARKREPQRDGAGEMKLDALVERLEAEIARQYTAGGPSDRTRAAIDRLRNMLQRRREG